MMRLFALQRYQLIDLRRSPHQEVTVDESGARLDRPVSQAFPAQGGKKKCDEAIAAAKSDGGEGDADLGAVIVGAIGAGAGALIGYIVGSRNQQSLIYETR